MSNSPLSIRDPEQIAVLASPIRQEIVDTIQALGTCSIAELARELGRPADGLYYHLRQLVAAGLVDPAGDRERNGRPEALYRTRAPERGLALHYDPTDPANKEAVTSVVGSMLRMTERDFRAGYEPGVDLEGSRRSLWAARGTAWLDDDELEEVNRLLRRLVEIFGSSKDGDDGRLHALMFSLAPLGDRAAGRRSGRAPSPPAGTPDES